MSASQKKSSSPTQATDWAGCSDHELFQRIAGRDEGALHELYRRYKVMAFRFDFKILQDVQLAEDAVQDKFFKIWRRRYQIRTAGGRTLGKFILQMNKSLCLDIIKAQHRRGEIMGAPRAEFAGEDAGALIDWVYRRACERQETGQPGPAEAEGYRQLVDRIVAFTEDNFSRSQYLAFWGFIAGYSYKDISQLYGMQAVAVRGCIARAFKAIRQHFGSEWQSL